MADTSPGLPAVELRHLLDDMDATFQRLAPHAPVTAEQTRDTAPVAVSRPATLPPVHGYRATA